MQEHGNRIEARLDSVMRCRRPYCNNEAVLGRAPNLCKEHHADRKRRQDATFAVPKCKGCNERTNHEDGYCTSCQREIERQNALARIRLQRKADLRNCDTVEELRNWIEEHLLHITYKD